MNAALGIWATMSGQSLLLVEDEPALLAALRRRLRLEGFTVHTAVTGIMALEVFEHDQPDLVVLDVMLPELDGFEVARRLRQITSRPILMLTARESVQDRVRGLEQGADDYLVKPFAFEELLARIRALVRRSRGEESPTQAGHLSLAHLELHPDRHQLLSNGQELSLTPREFELLHYFMKYPRQVLTRDKILTAVWGYDHEGTSNLIDVYVRSLRDKLEQSGQPRLLHTVRGVGYVLKD